MRKNYRGDAYAAATFQTRVLEQELRLSFPLRLDGQKKVDITEAGEGTGY